MNDDAAKRQPAETMSLEGRIDRLCERFEAAWKSGQPPQIEHYVELDFPTGRREPTA